MSEKNEQFTNPIKIDEDSFSFSKTSTRNVSKSELLALKADYEAELAKINDLLGKIATVE